MLAGNGYDGGANNTSPAQKKDHLLVAIRFRPLSEKERERGDREVWNCVGNSVGIIKEEAAGMDVKFAFDHVFPAGFSNQGVYETVGSSIVQSSLDGLNGTIFAYGVTSSGKTHTMMGDDVTPGIVPHAIAELYHLIGKLSKRKEITVHMSMLEIYNEVVNDLLNPANTNLRLREDPKRGIYVEGVQEEQLRSADHALHVVATGNEHRKTSATAFNEGSSRSHTVIRLAIEANDRPEFANEPGDRVGRTLSYLTMVDLAGSESAKAEKNASQRMEGSFINKSLLTLGTVIHKLSEGGAVHIPFRDSKLTRILSNSLTGNGARVAVICTITPASIQAEETHNTLKFASRAKKITIEAKRNEILDQSSLIARYQQELALLRHQLDIVMREGNRGSGDKTGNNNNGASDAAGGGGGVIDYHDPLNIEVRTLREKYQEEHMAVVAGEKDRDRLTIHVDRLTQCVLDSNAALGYLERRLRDEGGVPMDEQGHEPENDVLRRQVVALADELRDRERIIQKLAAAAGGDGEDFMVEEDLTLQVMQAEREYMQDKVQDAESRIGAMAVALERMRRTLAQARGVEPDSIDVEALINGDADVLGSDDGASDGEIERAATTLRHGYDHVLAERVMKMEEKVSMAIAALQRKEEKIAREREVHKTLTGLQDQVHTRVADLTAENATLKKELERVETQNERLLGYSVDDLSQAELFELIKNLTAAVERVRVTVLTKKIAVRSSPISLGGKLMMLSSPEQRGSRAGMTMSLEEMDKKIKSLKSYEGKKGRDEMMTMKENDISMLSLENDEKD
ncbi:hypothetical protein Ndes2526B_g01051 [Nannochloris sp. 'desiccata']|nr:putative Kinesin-like protein KIN-7D, chloroplastic [Chlorella desiccata (nom. nud.)]